MSHFPLPFLAPARSPLVSAGLFSDLSHLAAFLHVLPLQTIFFVWLTKSLRGWERKPKPLTDTDKQDNAVYSFEGYVLCSRSVARGKSCISY